MMRRREGLAPSFQKGDLVYYRGEMMGIVLEVRIQEVYVHYIYPRTTYAELPRNLVPGIWSFTGPVMATWRGADQGL
jgi:hypothetical protein